MTVKVLSVTQDAHLRHRHQLQAPVKAMDPHGVTVVSLGTSLFALASLVCWFLREPLAGAGRGWWLASCLTGLGIGLVALLFLLARRARHHRTPPSQGPRR